MYYIQYLSNLCRRRQWPQPHYESFSMSGGWACVARVNNREYQTDTIYGSDLLARENAAMRAYLICRNFSVNDGMYPSGHARGPVIQGLPVAIGTERRSIYTEDHDSGSRSGGSSPSSGSNSSYGDSRRTSRRISGTGRVLRYEDRRASSLAHAATEMQVTRRVSTALRFAVNSKKPEWSWPVTRVSYHLDQLPTSYHSVPSGKSLFSHASRVCVEGRVTGAAKELHQKSNDAHESDLNTAIAQEKEKQTKAPWHREGSNVPPVARQRSAGAMTKGKLLTTPSRLLKLIIPLTTRDHNTDRKDVEPLALLVHSQQPLSYLERLIQSELPTVKTARGEEKIPAVHFRAQDSPQDQIVPPEKQGARENDEEEGDLEESKFDGKTEKTGKLNRKKKTTEVAKGEGLGEGSVESYSGLGREAPDSKDGQEANFVRWSPSTEIGDFIRDAARGKEFAIEIEGAPEQIRIAVPSFNDRTHYLRQRLRKTSSKIMEMASIKRECDMAAHKGAQRVAIGGAGLLVGYWYVVYRLTFETDLGWDTMEPVTYLVGLSTLICGYLWFLYHNREVSYRAALNLTISRRQTKLYQAKGFDLHKWEQLVEEGNAFRKEIKQVAMEYDVEWDETADEKTELVRETLKQDRDRKEKKDDKENEKEDD
ncbi:MAG: hypothetical protein Q9203_005178 [Teloschistes exilis]